MTTDRIPAWIITAGSTDSPCETPRLTKVSNAVKIKSADVYKRQNLSSAGEVFEILNQAVEKCGYAPGEQICYAMDAAASELYDQEKDCYYFPGESQMNGSEVQRNSREMVEYYQELLDKFPIVSIEDGLHEDDWDGWQLMTQELGEKVQLVGDDLFVTNVKRLKCGIKLNAGNAILVKVNQIGTLTEAMDACLLYTSRCV